MSALPAAVWAWALVALAALNLVVQGAAAAALLVIHLRRHRPLERLAEAVADGDLDRARTLLERVPGRGGRELATIARPTLQNGPPKLARDRFLKAYLVAYPHVPLAPKLVVAVASGTAALLPLLVAAAGRAALTVSALQAGDSIPPEAARIYHLGAVETVAAGVVAWTLLLIAHRADPGARHHQRRLAGRLVGRGGVL